LSVAPVICTLRGLADSATGMRTVSTPASNRPRPAETRPRAAASRRRRRYFTPKPREDPPFVGSRDRTAIRRGMRLSTPTTSRHRRCSCLTRSRTTQRTSPAHPLTATRPQTHAHHTRNAKVECLDSERNTFFRLRWRVRLPSLMV
jgi:hypothetical protein